MNGSLWVPSGFALQSVAMLPFTAGIEATAGSAVLADPQLAMEHPASAGPIRKHGNISCLNEAQT